MPHELALDAFEVVANRLEHLRQIEETGLLHGIAHGVSISTQASASEVSTRQSCHCDSRPERTRSKFACGLRRRGCSAAIARAPRQRSRRLARPRRARCASRDAAPARETGCRSRPAADRPAPAAPRRAAARPSETSRCPRARRRTRGRARARAKARSPVKQCMTPARPAALTSLARSTASVSSSASRVWMTTGRSRATRQRDLRREDLLLDVARREVVVVVEADLAERARCRRLLVEWHRRTVAPASVDAVLPARRRDADGRRREPHGRPELAQTRHPRRARPDCPASRMQSARVDARRLRPLRRRASRSATNTSSARWQCESIIGTARLDRDAAARRQRRCRSRRAPACRLRGWRPAPCRSTRCPSASPASGWRR